MLIDFMDMFVYQSEPDQQHIPIRLWQTTHRGLAHSFLITQCANVGINTILLHNYRQVATGRSYYLIHTYI